MYPPTNHSHPHNTHNVLHGSRLEPHELYEEGDRCAMKSGNWEMVESLIGFKAETLELAFGSIIRPVVTEETIINKEGP